MLRRRKTNIVQSQGEGGGGGGDQLTVSENITREEGWFEGRDTNEILVRRLFVMKTINIQILINTTGHKNRGRGGQFCV